MPFVKKLLFAPIFLISFTSLLYLLSPLFKSYDFIFSFSVDTFIQLLIISTFLSFSSFLFVIFTTLSERRVTLVVGILASVSSLLFWEASLAIVFAVLILISLLLTYLNLEVSLKSYLTFAPNTIFGPSIRHLSGLLILAICIVYFLSANKMVSQNGFQIPDALIDASLKLTQPESNSQISLVQDTIKQAVKGQLQNLIKPYTGFIPAVLAILLFFTLQGLTSLINLLIYPLLWLTFYILEKTGFVHFEAETREVKKLVV